MGDVPPPAPFDAALRFPTPWVATRPALHAFLSLARAPYSADARAAAASQVSTLAEEAGLRNSSLAKYTAFWTGQYNRLPPSCSDGVMPLPVARAAGLHPLILAALEGDDAFAAAQPVWFNSEGGSRRLPARGGAETEPESDGGAERSGRDDPPRGNGGDEGGGGGAAPAGNGAGAGAGAGAAAGAGAVGGNPDPDDAGGGLTLAQLAARRVGGGRINAQALGGAVPPPPRDGGARQVAADFLDQRHGGAEEHDPDGDSEDEAGAFLEGAFPGAAGAPQGEASLAAVAAALQDEPDDPLADDLPRYAADYRLALARRGVAYHNKRSKQPLVSAWRMVAQELGVAFEDVRSIALGEHISFAALRDSRPGESADVSDELAAVYHLQQRNKASRPQPLDPFQWEEQFDKWERILRLVNAGAGYERERQRAAARYKAFVLQQYRRSADANDAQRARRALVDYDEMVRSEVARAPRDSLLPHFGACSTHDPLYLRIVGSVLSAANSRTRSPRDRARDLEPDRGPLRFCQRYNQGVDHTTDDTALAAAVPWMTGEEGDGAEEYAPLGYARGGLEVAADGEIDERAPENPLPGIGPAPRLQRSYLWPLPAAAPPTTPSLDASLTAPPLPRPPQSVLNDPRLRDIIRRRPYLVSTFSPLDHRALERALRGHPNRRWVASLVESVRDGFWPAHDGSEPTVPDPAKGDHLFPRRREDQDVQVKAAEKSRADGHFSIAFDELEDGMTVNAQFCVHKEGSEPRLVDDHSGSGLNDGIGSVGAKYDRLDCLVRYLRFAGLLTGELPENATLWKLDVSAAFKLLLMHPLWQLRQVVLVTYRDSRGRLRPRFHVQHRAAFGSKASPYLWTSLMSAVAWIVQSRAPSLVPFPHFYMDDAFNLDLSGLVEWIEHDGERRLVPAGQAATIRVWEEIGLKWKWKKAEHGRRLTITGIVVDLDAGTLTLEPAAVEKFAAAVETFIDKSQGRSRPLRVWRQLSGWACWALTVRPWARPLLSRLFAKLGRSSSPYAEIFVNDEIRDDLKAFVAELRSGEPLDLRDPALTEWTAKDADLVVFTDACLETTAKDGSGLGFWYMDRPSAPSSPAAKRCFSARPRRRYDNIGYAETLAVGSAVLHVLANEPGVRRLLIRTDSATAVYAFDAGGSRRPDVAALVRVAYGEARAKKVDVKVQHIRGVQNVTADRARKMSGQGRERRAVAFAPLAASAALPPAKAPFLSLPALRVQRRSLWEAAIAESTSDAYRRAYNHWTTFALAYRLPAFPTADSLSLFVTHRSSRVVATTLAGELSGLAFYFKAVDERRWAKARESAEVMRALLGNAKLNPHTVKKAEPVAVEDVRRGVEAALGRRTYDGLLWAAMTAVCFLSCARAQELCSYNNPLYANSRKTILRETVRLSPSGFSSSLPFHKGDPLFTGTKLWYAAVDAGDFHAVVSAYIAARDRLHGAGGALWLDEKGDEPGRRWFVERAKARCGERYTGHSFRAGGASWYARRGASDATIMRLGRWQSAAWLDYVRLQPEIAVAQRERDLAAAPPLPPPALPPAALAALAPFL
ncbi:hypothetical protein JCM10213_001099 [Rhodosporidiobolus nylandii]